MYRKPIGQMSLLEDFRFFAGGKLDANNRWLKMSDLIAGMFFKIDMLHISQSIHEM